MDRGAGELAGHMLSHRLAKMQGGLSVSDIVAAIRRAGLGRRASISWRVAHIALGGGTPVYPALAAQKQAMELAEYGKEGSTGQTKISKVLVMFAWASKAIVTPPGLVTLPGAS